jgi:hypothetical protein
MPSLSSSSPPETELNRSALLLCIFSDHQPELYAPTARGSSASPFFGRRRISGNAVDLQLLSFHRVPVCPPGEPAHLSPLSPTHFHRRSRSCHRRPHGAPPMSSPPSRWSLSWSSDSVAVLSASWRFQRA